MSHGNARLNVRGRLLLVERVLGDRRPVSHVAAELGISRQCAHRWVNRYLTGLVIGSSKQTAVRYERDRPGELVHMDVKKLGRIPDGGGWRAHGRSEEVRGRGIGFDYVHSLVDDHSRLAYSEIHPDEKGTTCAAFLLRAAGYFADHGITRIERIMTDNAFAYRYSLHDAVAQLDAKQVFIRPHCPWQNGKVERELQHSTNPLRHRRPANQPTVTNVTAEYS